MRLDWSSIVDNEFDALKQAAGMDPKLGSSHCRCRRHSFHPGTDCLDKMIGTANDICRVHLARHKCSIVAMAKADSILDSFSRYPKHPTGFLLCPGFQHFRSVEKPIFLSVIQKSTIDRLSACSFVTSLFFNVCSLKLNLNLTPSVFSNKCFILICGRLLDEIRFSLYILRIVNN